MDDSSATALRRLVNGYQAAQAIHVAAALGIADLLADGAKTSDELAAATETHAGALYRLLRALAGLGVFHEDEERRFSLTPLGDCLRTDAPESLAGWAAFIGRPYYWQAWGALGESVRTGENAFRLLHGTDVWEYRSRRPEESAIFDRAMTALTGSANRSLLEAYDFGRFETLVDVGGGNGTLLAAILAANPDLRGVLIDQPHVVSHAEEVLERAGVADRCEIVGGSFFDSVPAGGDAYLLKSIVHDWEDEQARAILLSCRRALGEQGTLLVVERILGPPNEGAEGKFSDLNMLVAPGGRERTLEEYDALLASAGFRLGGATPTRSGLNLIEATPTTYSTADWRAVRPAAGGVRVSGVCVVPTSGYGAELRRHEPQDSPGELVLDLVVEKPTEIVLPVVSSVEVAYAEPDGRFEAVTILPDGPRRLPVEAGD